MGAALAITWRYDVFPALLLMAGLAAAIDGRPAAVGLAAAVGAPAKLFPAAALPALTTRWPRGSGLDDVLLLMLPKNLRLTTSRCTDQTGSWRDDGGRSAN